MTSRELGRDSDRKRLSCSTLQWVSEIRYRNAIMITLMLVLSAAYMGRGAETGLGPT